MSSASMVCLKKCHSWKDFPGNLTALKVPLMERLPSRFNSPKPQGHIKIMHAYGPKSTPIAQGLVEDVNAKHGLRASLCTNSPRDGV